MNSLDNIVILFFPLVYYPTPTQSTSPFILPKNISKHSWPASEDFIFWVSLKLYSFDLSLEFIYFYRNFISY